jgi:hypothetical protein
MKIIVILLFNILNLGKILSADEVNKNNLYFVVSKLTTNDVNNPTQEDNKNKLNAEEFILNSNFFINVIIYKIKLNDEERNTIELLKKEAREVEKKEIEWHLKYPDISFNRKLPDGGAIGEICLKDESGKMLPIIEVSKLGNPIWAYSILQTNDETSRIFKNILLKFLLSTNTDIKQYSVDTDKPMPARDNNEDE